MSKVDIYEYAGCSTCKKAKKWLDTQGIAYRVVPIVEAPPSAKELRVFADASGLPVRKLLNVSGASYRDLLATRGKAAVDALEDASLLELLAADGKMIKRPLLVRGKTVIVGFDEAAYARAFKG